MLSPPRRGRDARPICTGGLDARPICTGGSRGGGGGHRGAEDAERKGDEVLATRDKLRVQTPCEELHPVRSSRFSARSAVQGCGRGARGGAAVPHKAARSCTKLHGAARGRRTGLTRAGQVGAHVRGRAGRPLCALLGGQEEEGARPPPALVLPLSVSLLYSLSAAVARARGWTPRTGLCWGGMT